MKVTIDTKRSHLLEAPEFEMTVDSAIREILWDLIGNDVIVDFVKFRLKDYNTSDNDNVFDCIQSIRESFKGEDIVIPEEEK